jgi:hypothetical protein
MATDDPTRNGHRAPDGRFLPGHQFARGNPNNRKVQQLRNRLLSAVTEEDIEAVVKKLISMAREGNIHAIRELLDRTFGKPTASIELSQAEAKERIEELTDAQLMEIATGAAGGRE